MRIPVKKPCLTLAQIEKRLNWAMEHDGESWESTLFSDESVFQIGGHRLKRWEFDDEEIFFQTVKFPTKIMVWGAIHKGGRTSLYIVEGTMTADKYSSEVLDKHLKPYMRENCRQWYRLYQDGASSHTAKLTKRRVAAMRLKVMTSPPNSPDINPIENIWGLMDVHIKEKEPRTKAELVAAVKEAWEKIPQNTIDNVIDSMPRRIQAVMDNDGKWTKY